MIVVTKECSELIRNKHLSIAQVQVVVTVSVSHPL